MSNSQSPDDGVDQPRQSVYVESEIIMTTVRVVAPFAFTYGLFLTFHGGGRRAAASRGCDHRVDHPDDRLRVRYRTDP
ncbi:hypothetical protein ACFQH2_11550 [Natronoarchaeum sp. GCM10025703]|uniref:hypothetical protein n=1 Tax=Natronoarchaeum sp. GCM10025703 TaxID=3252685 RepID=UPI00360645CA